MGIKRLPPILFPIWLVIIAINYFIRMLMWLVGYWWCDDCGQRGNLKTDRYDVRYSDTVFNPYTRETVHKDKIKHVCGKCYVDKYADSRSNFKEIKNIGDKIMDE